MQVTYDKLETTNVFSKHFGECRGDGIELDKDTTLTVRGEAARYQVCHSALRDKHLLVAAVSAFLHQLLLLCIRTGHEWHCCQAIAVIPIASILWGGLG